MMRASILIWGSTALLLFSAGGAQAAESGRMDAASHQALHETQQMLTTPAERQKALSIDPRARAVDAQVRQTLGDENMADVYALAAELMGTLTTESGGDPVKMMELMQKAASNPEILAGKLTPSQMEKLRKIVNRLPAGAAPQNPPTKQK